MRDNIDFSVSNAELSIFAAFMKDPKREATISDLARDADATYSYIYKAVQKPGKRGLLDI